MHFDADRMLLIQNLPVSSVLWPSHFRRDAVGVPTRREMNIGKQRSGHDLVPRRFHRDARDRGQFTAHHGLMSTGD
jgi:hypothetical protein